MTMTMTRGGQISHALLTPPRHSNDNKTYNPTSAFDNDNKQTKNKGQQLANNN